MRGRLEGLARGELATKMTAVEPANLGFPLSRHHSRSSNSKQMLGAHEIIILQMLLRIVIIAY